MVGMERGASTADVVGCVGKAGHFVDRDGLGRVAVVRAVTKEFLRAAALGFMAASRGRELLYSYFEDSTPLRLSYHSTAQAPSDSSVQQSGKKTAKLYRECAFFWSFEAAGEAERVRNLKRLTAIARQVLQPLCRRGPPQTRTNVAHDVVAQGRVDQRLFANG